MSLCPGIAEMRGSWFHDYSMRLHEYTLPPNVVEKLSKLCCAPGGDVHFDEKKGSLPSSCETETVDSPACETSGWIV